jgi:hypothetical protein
MSDLSQASTVSNTVDPQLTPPTSSEDINSLSSQSTGTYASQTDYVPNSQPDDGLDGQPRSALRQGLPQLSTRMSPPPTYATAAISLQAGQKRTASGAYKSASSVSPVKSSPDMTTPTPNSATTESNASVVSHFLISNSSTGILTECLVEL